MGSSGSGTSSHLNIAAINRFADAKILHVPYRGGGPAMADLIAGHVDLTLPSSQVAQPLQATNRIKCLAVTGKERSPALPEVPTLAEAGIKHADVDLRFWFAVFGPKGLPENVTAKLQNAIQAALKTPELSGRLKALDITPDYAPGPELQKRVVSDIKNWGAFIEAKGLKDQ